LSQVRTVIEPAKVVTDRRMPFDTGIVWSERGRDDGDAGACGGRGLAGGCGDAGAGRGAGAGCGICEGCGVCAAAGSAIASVSATHESHKRHEGVRIIPFSLFLLSRPR
jgi:hypothetical protein